MKFIAVPALIMSALSFYTGGYHLILFSRERKDKNNLTFGLLCLTVGFYDLCACGVYNADSVVQAAPWQRGELISLMFGALALIWFVAYYTSIRPKKLLIGLSIYFVLAAIVHIINPDSLVWKPLDQASVKQFAILGSAPIIYYEMSPGPFIDIQSVITLIIFAFVFGMAIRFYRQGQRQAAFPLLISLIFLWIGVFNDTFVSSGVYKFIYLFEYSFMAIVIFMAFSLTKQIAGISKNLVESEERLRSTLQSIDDLVFDISKEGVFQNYPTSEDRPNLILPPEQFIGKSLEEVLPTQIADVFTEEIDQLVKTSQVQQFDYPLKIDGEERWFSGKLSMRRDAAGEYAGVILVSREITDRKKAEEEIRNLNLELEDRVEERTRQLEEKNQELEAFSYSIAHDLRAPLRAINGFSTILLEDYQKTLDQEGELLLGHIIAASQRMHDLIDSLLTLSQLSRQSLEIESVNIIELVENIAKEQIHQHPEKTIELSTRFETADCSQVQADKSLISVILTNLFSNAIKFSGQQDTAEIEFGCQMSAGSPRYFIKDNGIGFDPANADRMFKPFQRLHSGDDFEGTGIGLAIVDRIIKRHNGKIWAQSAPGEGTTFFFTLGEPRKDIA